MAKPPFQHVLAHWGMLIEGFQTSSVEFYASVESALQRRDVPEVDVCRVNYKESGVLSAKREYLRVSRRRLLFDVCAAPFGTGFFFSWWQVTPPLRLGIVFGLLLACFEFVVAYIIAGTRFPVSQFQIQDLRNPFVRHALTLAFLGALVVFVLLCILARLGVRLLDDLLMPIPLAGTIYRRFFRPVTYYELDTMAMYRSAVHAAVTEVIDGLTNAKGLRTLAAEERKPIMRDFWKQ